MSCVWLCTSSLLNNDSLYCFMLMSLAVTWRISAHLIKEVCYEEVPLFFLFVPVFSPALQLSSFFNLFGLLSARRRDNILDESHADKWMPAAALSEWQITLCHSGSVYLKPRQTYRQKDVGCLFVLACGICGFSKKYFASIHLWKSLASELFFHLSTTGKAE